MQVLWETNFWCVFFQTMQFEAGKDSLEREFRSLLSRHSRPVPPVAILDLLVGEEGQCSRQYSWIMLNL